MRRSLAGLALISRDVSGETRYLLQWNVKWSRYSLVGGHKRDDESFRDCLIRELFEELGLQAGIDLAVADQPLARLEYTAWSASALQHTHYIFELFDVSGLTAQAQEQIDANPCNHWASAAEVLYRRQGSGLPIADNVSLLFRQAGLQGFSTPQPSREPRPPSSDSDVS
jgi:8-oxo-dGTP pyrophosphatase MutT (NUDIX family)